MTTCLRADAGSGFNYPFLTSKERDNETGLDYFGERYYASTQGRFTSVDPLMASATTQDPQSFNRYTFVLNNPLRYVDPDGMDAWDQLTKEERKIITPKITVPKGQTVRRAFNNLATVKDAKGKIDKQATADKVTTIKNFIDSAGGHTNSAVWQQIQTVNSIDLGRNPTDQSKTEGRVTVSVADREQFTKVLDQNGYAVNRSYEIFSPHENDSARQITQTSFEPGMHFANDDPSNLNKFYVHWDRRSTAFRQGSDRYWTRLGEQYDAASTHNNPYTPSQLRQELKKNGTVPRRER
ncbi:MAG TPA: RHS repeat-associated core domain-containing protein [Pyrinomonadaceae bacterium]|nr:RHS repeat-associated core domain-containing protein [Pyrinomonadaceae bacterium]